MVEDGDDDVALLDVGDDAAAAAAGAGQHILEVDSSEQAGPVDPCANLHDNAGSEARARAVRCDVLARGT